MNPRHKFVFFRGGPEAAKLERRRPFALPSWVLPLMAQAQRHTLALVFLAGLFVGLVVLGWGLWPVEWVDGRFGDLSLSQQVILVQAAADLNAYDTLNPTAVQLARDWGGDVLACQMVKETTDPAEVARLISLAYRLNGVGCQ